jgi:hypothetical protein
MWILFAAVCGVTAVIWPWRFQVDIMGSATMAANAILCSGPTGLGVALLVCRNALFATMTIFLFMRVVRRGAA